MFAKYCKSKCCRGYVKESVDKLHDAKIRYFFADRDAQAAQARWDYYDAKVRVSEFELAAIQKRIAFLEEFL